MAVTLYLPDEVRDAVNRGDLDGRWGGEVIYGSCAVIQLGQKRTQTFRGLSISTDGIVIHPGIRSPVQSASDAEAMLVALEYYAQLLAKGGR